MDWPTSARAREPIGDGNDSREVPDRPERQGRTRRGRGSWPVALAAALWVLAACGSGDGETAEAVAPTDQVPTDFGACTEPNERGWCWQRPGQPGLPISQMWHPDSRLSLAMGSGGAVLATLNGGLEWFVVHPPRREPFSVMLFVDANHGVAIASPTMWSQPYFETVHRTSDGGRTWQPALQIETSFGSTPSGRLRLMDDGSLLFRPQPVWMGDAMGWISRDRGATWAAQSGRRPCEPSGEDFFIASAGEFWCVGQAMATVRHSRDGGLTATFVTLPSVSPLYHRINGFTARGSGVAAALTNSGLTLPGDPPTNAAPSYKLFVTRDHGATWFTNLSFETPLDAVFDRELAIDAAATRIASWCALGACRPLLSVDGGRTVTSLALPTELSATDLAEVHVLEGRRLVVRATDSGAGGGGARAEWVSEDDGASWRRVDARASVQSTVLEIWFLDRQVGVAYTSSETVLRTVDGGRSWTERVLGGPTPGRTAALEARRYCKPGAVVQRNYCSVGEHSPATGLRFTADGTLGWMYRKAALYLSTDRGLTWQVNVSRPDGSILSVDFVDARTGRLLVYQGGRGAVLYRTDDGGTSWVEAGAFAPGDLVEIGSIAFANRDVGLVATNGGVWTTADAGATWTARGGPGLRRARFADAQTVVGLSISYIGPDRVWVSRDAGATWAMKGAEELGDFAVRWAGGLHVLGAESFVVVGGAGRVQRTRDGGNTWTDVGVASGPVLGGVFFLDDTTGWITGANGAILSTTSGGLP